MNLLKKKREIQSANTLQDTTLYPFGRDSERYIFNVIDQRKDTNQIPKKNDIEINRLLNGKIG